MSLIAPVPGNAATGTGVAVSTFDVALPNPATAGNVVVCFVNGTSNMILPDGWGLILNHTFVYYAFFHTVEADGEQTWTYDANGTASPSWWVAEYTGIDPVDPIHVATTGTATVAQAATATPTAATTVADTLVLAGYYVTRGASGVGVFPAGWSFSDSFAEIAYEQNPVGGGNTIGDNRLYVAALQPDATGSYTTTLTWDTSGGGTLTNLNAYPLIVALSAAAQQIIDAPITITPGGVQ